MFVVKSGAITVHNTTGVSVETSADWHSAAANCHQYSGTALSHQHFLLVTIFTAVF